MALSAGIELPGQWQSDLQANWLLERLLKSPHYEVRELTLGGLLRRLKEEQGGDEGLKTKHPWLDESNVSKLTSLALHETHPQCLAKVLQVLSVLSSSSDLKWNDGMKIYSQQEVLQYLVTLTQNSAHSVELHSAALMLSSELLVKLVTSDPQGVSALACLPQWGALVCSGCGEEQPVEVKLTAAKVLVTCTSTLMTNPALPLGLSTTISLWRSLFELLQDEDQDVRNSVSDFTSEVPPHLLSPDVCGMSMCPPAALCIGVELLCHMFELWGQLGAGLLALTQWLLGDEEDRSGSSLEPCSLDEEDFLFEKGDLNLWAEPLQWVKLLHRHLGSLVARLERLGQMGGVGPERALLMRGQAQARLAGAQRALQRLPALPQFCCGVEHSRLSLLQHRAGLALEVLDRLDARHHGQV